MRARVDGGCRRPGCAVEARSLGGGGARVKRARTDDASEGKGGKVSKRRVLERLMREAYDAASTRGAVPFQSWRRGLPKSEAERLEALAEAEAGEAGA